MRVEKWENEPYLPQKLPFAVGPARLGVGHHLGQLRFGLIRFILVGFRRRRRLVGSALRNGLKYIRIHGVARNTLRRCETTGIHRTRRWKGPAGFICVLLLNIPFCSGVNLVRSDKSTASNSIHPACPGTALARFIGASDVTEPGAGRGGALEKKSRPFDPDTNSPRGEVKA